MLSCAFFRRGFNTQLSSRNELVQCLTCFEWYHCVCLGISLEEAKDFTIVDCRCTLPHPNRSHDMWVYSGIPVFEPPDNSNPWDAVSLLSVEHCNFTPIPKATLLFEQSFVYLECSIKSWFHCTFSAAFLFWLVYNVFKRSVLFILSIIFCRSVYSNQGSILRFLAKAYLKVCTLTIHLL